ncbi:hypothetical protein LEMLEM_LOCUS5543 [Lemmus lemmus]
MSISILPPSPLTPPSDPQLPGEDEASPSPQPWPSLFQILPSTLEVLSGGRHRGLWSQSHNQVTRKPAALPGEASFPDPVLLSFEHSTVQRNGPQPKEKPDSTQTGRTTKCPTAGNNGSLRSSLQCRTQDVWKGDLSMRWQGTKSQKKPAPDGLQLCP